MEVVKRFDVWLMSLDPSVGSELRKTRPCIVVSPDETNRHLNTIVVVPLTTAEHSYAFRLNLTFLGRSAQAAVDQVRVLDKGRLIKRVGALDLEIGQQLLHGLRVYFT
jgi:mRNA interferase MazF